MKKKITGILFLAGAAVIAAGIFFGSGRGRDPDAVGRESEYSDIDSGSLKDGTGRENGNSSDEFVSDRVEVPGPETDAIETDEKPEELSATEDSETEITEKTETAAEGFQISGMEDELLSLIGTEEDFADELQRQLYAYGYYDYSSAKILEYTYDENSVDIDLYVNANVEVDAEMIYSIDTGTWQLKIW